LWIALALFVGLRFKVGGDWGSYVSWFDFTRSQDLSAAVQLSDPGYRLVNWISGYLGWGVYGANLICAMIFSFALIAFSRAQPLPWLALAVSVPYLVIVLGMGYTRQGIAFGFALLGFLALRREDHRRFVAWVVLGALFHKTAVLLLPIAALTRSKNRLWTVFWIAVTSIGAYLVLLADSVDSYYVNYVETEYQSQGAFVRLSMNALPALLYIVWERRFRMTASEASLWRWISIISLVLFAAYFVAPSSTAVDRIALYALPLQLVVFSRLPHVLGPANGGLRLWILFVIMYYATVQFVWLNFASHAEYWLPYRFYPLELLQ